MSNVNTRNTTTRASRWWASAWTKTRDALDKFLDNEKLPWVTLNETKDEHGGSSMADYYGIIGIPAVFLVDKEGKVVTLQARGEKLGMELARLLGPAKGEAKPWRHREIGTSN